MVGLVQVVVVHHGVAEAQPRTWGQQSQPPGPRALELELPGYWCQGLK